MAQAIWTDRSGSPTIRFDMDATGRVTATNQTNGDRIQERNITVETENLSALMRGIPQRSFSLDQLTAQQKAALMGSLKNRDMEVLNGVGSIPGSIVIQALP